MWVGANAAKHVAEMAAEAGRRLASRPPTEMGAGTSGLSLMSLEDGTEGRAPEFWEALGGTRESFRSLSAGITS